MAKELDSKKMWASLIKHTTVSWIGTLIKKAFKDQGFKFDGEHIVSIKPEFKIEDGKWYVCIKSCLGYTVGKMYKAPQGNLFMGEDCFRPATEEEIAASGRNKNQIGGQKGGQKPKFKVGDWVVSPTGVYWHIDRIVNNRYEVTSDTGKCTDWPLDTDLYHLWTIGDAKDGDVLVTKNKNIFIFKSLSGCTIYDYCGLYYEKFFEFSATVNGLVATQLPTDYVPATKEQCDLLFQKMKEEGYEWDAEKKELKKIEQKPSNVFNIYEQPLLEKFKQEIVMKVVIEINGVRHRLVENKQYISCTQCSLEKYCSRLCQEPYGGNTICAFFKLAGSYRFVKE